jgi:hypothetical protein
METKIYREPENESLLLDESQLEEYNALALKLGFTTQEKADANLKPNVYPILNAAMQKQLKALCPSEVDAAKYTRSTIPLEVLKVYEFALDNEMFDGFKIWYDDKAPDPMLIGWNYRSESDRKNKYTWNVDAYLMARWGDCAMEIPELLILGFERLKQTLIDNANIGMTLLKAVQEDPAAYVRKHLNGTSNSDFRVDLLND